MVKIFNKIRIYTEHNKYYYLSEDGKNKLKYFFLAQFNSKSAENSQHWFNAVIELLEYAGYEVKLKETDRVVKNRVEN